MTDSTPEQIPGQQELPEGAPSATEILQEGEGPTPEADALDERDDKAESKGDEPADTGGTPDPTPASNADSPVEHRFRIIKQDHVDGSDTATHTFTSEEMTAEKAIKWLAVHLPAGVKLAELLESVL
jgi:hypothetical protein